jgi:uncharacterized protein YbjT (DUF2867 family)
VVTGATGPVGRHVVAGLVARGADVRAVTRNPARAGLPSGARVVAGDPFEPESLEPAFAGAGSLVLGAVPQTAGGVLAVAVAAGVEHVVLVSSAAVTAGYDTTYHPPVEEAVRASGMAWSVVRPGEFAMNSLLIWGPSIRRERRAVEPFPEQVGSPVHERDIADVILADLTDPARRGRIDSLIGPTSLSKRRQVAQIAAAIGADVMLDQVTADEAHRFYRAQGGFAADNADFLFGFESYDGVAGDVDTPPETPPGEDPRYDTLAEITGQPGRSYAEWARDHTADFT